MTIKKEILTSRLFIICLIILLINDLLLKNIFGNWLTGKLSDFSGLFIFPLFWTTFFPNFKKHIYWLTGIAFIFWKSQLSDSLIQTWNEVMPITISRVVDYTDYLALLILPLSFIYEKSLSKSKIFKIHPTLIITLVSFSFIATSYNTDLKVNKEYNFDYSLDLLKHNLFYLPDVYNWQREEYKKDKSGSFYINIYNKDTMINLDSLIPNFIHDTMDLSVVADFCFDGFDANIILSGNEHNSKIELMGFHHVCPKNENQDDLEQLTKIFEQKVIDDLKK